MADRTMVWHIPTLPAVTPVYYADRDYSATALRIYAERAPDGDMTVDILDDGNSIMNVNATQTLTFKSEDAYIEYGTLSGTFTVNERVTGGTSGATAYVKAVKVGGLILRDASTTAFTVDETITGLSSSATAVVHAYVRQNKGYVAGTASGCSRAILPKGRNANEAAQDFQTSVEIREGSWVSLLLLDAAGASNITVQLDLDALDITGENRPTHQGSR